MQDLCTYLKITELESVAEFPGEMEMLQSIITGIEEQNGVRMRMSADIADSSNAVKTLVRSLSLTICCIAIVVAFGFSVRCLGSLFSTTLSFLLSLLLLECPVRVFSCHPHTN